MLVRMRRLAPFLPIAAALTVGVPSVPVTSWYAAQQPLSVCNGVNGVNAAQLQNKLLPLQATALNNSYTAIGLFIASGWDTRLPLLSDTDWFLPLMVSVENNALVCSALPPELPAHLLDLGSVSQVRAPDSCPGMACIIGGNSSVMMCTHGHNSWFQGPSLGFRVSYGTLVDVLDPMTGTVHLYFFNGLREGGPADQRIMRSKLNSTTCRMEPWETVSMQNPLGARVRVVAAPAPMQDGIYIGMGKEIRLIQQVDSGTWAPDLWFIPLGQVSDPASWRVVTRTLVDPVMSSMPGATPIFYEAAMKFDNSNMVAAAYDKATAAQRRMEWMMAGPTIDRETFSGVIPVVCVVTGQTTVMGLGVDVGDDNRKVLAGMQMVPHKHSFFPVVSSDFLNDGPNMRCPVAMQSKVHAGGVLVVGSPGDLEAFGQFHTVAGWPYKDCQDSQCPWGTYTLTCASNPYDYSCFPCSTCKGEGLEVQIMPCGSAGRRPRYGDTQCETCAQCGPFHFTESVCNVTHPTICRAYPTPAGVNILPDANVPMGLLYAMAGLVGAVWLSGVTFVTMCVLHVVRLRVQAGHLRKQGDEATISFFSAGHWSSYAMACLSVFELSRVAVLLVMSAHLIYGWADLSVAVGAGLLVATVGSVLTTLWMRRSLGEGIEAAPWTAFGAMLHPRAMMMNSGAMLRTEATVLSPQAAIRVAYAAAGCTLVTDLLPSLALLRIATIHATAAFSLPAVLASVVLCATGLATGMVASRRIGKLQVLRKIAGEVQKQQADSAVIVRKSALHVPNGSSSHSGTGAPVVVTGRDQRVSALLQPVKTAEPLITASSSTVNPDGRGSSTLEPAFVGASAPLPFVASAGVHIYSNVHVGSPAASSEVSVSDADGEEYRNASTDSSGSSDVQKYVAVALSSRIGRNVDIQTLLADAGVQRGAGRK